MLVLDMMQPILPPLPRRGMYIQLLELKISMLLKNPTKHTSIMTLTQPSDDFYQVHQVKQGKPPPTPLSGFQRNHPRKPTPSTTKKPFKKYDVPVYVPAEAYSSSAQRLLLPLRNTSLRPSAKLLRKGAFMSRTLLTMNQPHLRIPHMRNNLIPIHLVIHPQMTLTQSWIISISNITKRKT